ncbi:MAG: diacylglycerol kinase [Gammaproteobacteria bacterium]|nr:MAG: diacylglycerol kinase [Gammaproteobacteria bacterium]
MAYSGNTGLKRLLLAGVYSWQGLKTCYRKEEAFKQEVWLAVVLIPLAFYLGDSGIEIAIMVASVLLVMIVEILNSAIEAVVDRIGMERHKLSGRAKDMGSAAVLLSLLNVVVMWSLMLFY